MEPSETQRWSGSRRESGAGIRSGYIYVYILAIDINGYVTDAEGLKVHTKRRTKKRKKVPGVSMGAHFLKQRLNEGGCESRFYRLLSDSSALCLGTTGKEKSMQAISFPPCVRKCE